MQLDDVEDALNNPPEKLREYFAKNGLYFYEVYAYVIICTNIPNILIFAWCTTLVAASVYTVEVYRAIMLCLLLSAKL